MVEKPKILFLCTGNSCRSQMAEGWTRALWGDRVEVYSAGLEVHGLNPHAVAVMAEAGVDISGQYSKRTDAVMDVDFDLVITVCDHAHETCPIFPGSPRVLHAGFEDPPRLAAAAATAAAKLECYRRVRDRIREYVETLPETLAGVGLVLPPAAGGEEDAPPRPSPLNLAVARAIRETVGPASDAAVFEYGCGNALLSLALAPHVGRITAVDSAAEVLVEAERNRQAAGLENLRILRLDLTRDEPPAERFDLVVISMALHHIEGTGEILEALIGLLRPGGWLAIADLYREDGSFHTTITVPHDGFDPADLAAVLARLGLAENSWREIHVIDRNDRQYPVFFLAGRKPGGCAPPSEVRPAE